nr:MAG TPA: hypothetical protein [Caudoviricetes sp.]
MSLVPRVIPLYPPVVIGSRSLPLNASGIILYNPSS